MDDLVVAVVGIAVVCAALLVARRTRERTHRRSATSGLEIDAKGVRRELFDGRLETIEWAAVSQVEVVVTPVKTADGASEFVLLYESETSGVLVPLGIGHDEALVTELTRLVGFGLAAFESARSESAPHREAVWTSPTMDS